MARAQALAGDRVVEVAAGATSGRSTQHLLEDPDVVIQGNRVLHLPYRVRR